MPLQFRNDAGIRCKFADVDRIQWLFSIFSNDLGGESLPHSWRTVKNNDEALSTNISQLNFAQWTTYLALGWNNVTEDLFFVCLMFPYQGDKHVFG